MFHSHTTHADTNDTAQAVDRLRRLLPVPPRLLPVLVEPAPRQVMQPEITNDPPREPPSGTTSGPLPPSVPGAHPPRSGAPPGRKARPAPPTPAAPDPPDEPPVGAPGGDPFVWPEFDEVPVPSTARPRASTPDPTPGSDPPQPPDAGPSPGLIDPDDEIPDVEVTPARLRRGHVVVIAAVLLVAIIGAGALLLRSRPSTEPIAQPSVRATLLSTGKPVASSSSVPAGYRRTSQGATFLLVHVAGKVRRPGVVRLPVGARVYDALEAAGGARPGVDLTTLNLARPLVDGEQVAVGVEQSPQARGSPPPNVANGMPTDAPAAPVNLNTATVQELDSLPGVGPVLAQRIIDARDERGGFTNVQELREVSGIGDRKYAELEQRVTVR